MCFIEKRNCIRICKREDRVPDLVRLLGWVGYGVAGHHIPSPETYSLEPAPSLRRSCCHITLSVKLNDYVCSHVCSNQLSSLILGLPKGTHYPLPNYVSYHRYKLAYRTFVSKLNAVKKPMSYSKAAAHPDWQKAMRSELQALQANGTWSLTPLLVGMTSIGCQWMYTIKHHSYGSIEHYKG